MALTITDLGTDEEVFASDLAEIHFSDKLREVRLLVKLEEWSFPAAGWYQFTLLVDGEWVAHKMLEVASEEEEP